MTRHGLLYCGGGFPPLWLAVEQANSGGMPLPLLCIALPHNPREN
jgi:hypothetical protein